MAGILNVGYNKNNNKWAMVVVMVLMSGVVWTGRCAAEGGEGVRTVGECLEEKRLGVNACKPVIAGFEPSPQCCDRVRLSHFQCICPLMSDRLSALIGNDRALRILRTCGRRIPPNFRCGGLHS